MSAYAKLLAVAISPLALVCLFSLPLILLGFIEPDPHPWNWFSLYIIDFFFGCLLLLQVGGFVRRSSWNRLATAALGGYAIIAFGQMFLEMVLDVMGVQPAPVAHKAFMTALMLYGHVVGIAMLVFSFKFPGHWFRYGQGKKYE